MSDFQAFMEDYYRRFGEAIEAFDRASLEGVLGVFDQVRERGGTLWVAGNGGSAAIANHTICDATKLTHAAGARSFRTQSLPANVPMLTALGNDLSYEHVITVIDVISSVKTRAGSSTFAASSAMN